MFWHVENQNIHTEMQLHNIKLRLEYKCRKVTQFFLQCYPATYYLAYKFVTNSTKLFN